MVAQSAPTREERAARGTAAPIWARSNVQRLIRTVTRLVGIQTQLLVLRTKLTAQKIILYAAFMAGAMAAAVLGMIFLVIGLFKALTSGLARLVGPEWAPTLSFIIFALALLGGALVLVLLARNTFAAPKPDHDASLSQESPASPAESQA